MLPFLRNGKRLYPWVLSALAETAVAIPWLIFTYSIQNERGWPEALPGVWVLLLAYLAAGLWEAGAPGGNAAEANGPESGAGGRRLAAMAVGLAGIYAIAYAAMPPTMRPGSLLSPNLALAVLPVAAYLWYQGARSGTDGIYYARVFQRFTWQGVAMTVGIVMLLIAHSAADPRVQLLLAWSVPLLFASGLTLLVVTRERELRSSQARNGDQGSGGGGAGSPATTGMIVGLLGLTLAASSLLSLERLARIGTAIWSVIDRPLSWLGDLFLLILYRWILLFWLVLGPLLAWLQRRAPPKPPNQPELNTGDMQQQLQQMAGPDRLWNLAPYVKAAVVIAALVLLAVGLYQLNRRVRKAAPADEERISLGFWAHLLADLRGLFTRSATAMAGLAAAPAGAALDPRDPRALYRKLQAWGAALGRPRRPGETPSAYEAALGEHQPVGKPAVGAVTALYNQARYGASPPASGAVAQAARELSELADAGRAPARE